MPASSRQKALTRLEMEVIARPVYLLFRAGMPEIHPDVGLIRAFVFGKSNVTINPKQRAALRLGIGNHPRTDLPQAKAQVGDKPKARLADSLFIPLPIFQKPLAFIVALELAKEEKELRCEISFGHVSNRYQDEALAVRY